MLCKQMALVMGVAWCALLVACDDETSRRPPQDGDISVAFDSGPPGDAATSDAASPPQDAVASEAAVASDTGVDAVPLGMAFYVSPTGVDTNAGTMAAPLKTISKALSKAAANDTVWLLDGVWDASVDPKLAVATAGPCTIDTGLVVPTGVTLAAVNARQATIRVTGSYGVCLRGGILKNIHFHRPTGQGGQIDVRGVGNVIEGSTFSGVYGCGGSGWEAAVYVDDAAKLTFSGGDLIDSASDGLGCQFLTVRGASEVNVKQMKINSGKAAITSGSGTIIVVDNSRVRLSGVTLTNVATAARGMGLGVGHVVLDMGSEIRGFSNYGISVRGVGATIALTDSAIKNNGIGIGVEYGYSGGAVIEASNTLFDANRLGVHQGTGTTAEVRLRNTRVINHTQAGIQMGTSAKLDIEGGEISANAQEGVSVTTGAPGTCNVKLRNAKITNNGNVGVNIVCYSGSVADLGTLLSPGANTFTGNAVGVALTAGGFVATAVGNTWTPSVQAADALGKYSAVGAAAKVEVTSGMGVNYRVTTGTLRLAENP